MCIKHTCFYSVSSAFDFAVFLLSDQAIDKVIFNYSRQVPRHCMYLHPSIQTVLGVVVNIFSYRITCVLHMLIVHTTEYLCKIRKKN